jgi:hypothetical protein
MLDLILRDAASRPTSWCPETRCIDAVIATNAPVARRDAKGEFLEILDPKGADLKGLVGASVLDAHMSAGVRNVLGVVESARVEGDSIVATLRLSDRAEIADIVRDISTGIIRNLSVGYSVSQWADGTADGKRTRTATNYVIKEVSFCPVGADGNAKTRSSNTMPRSSINRAIRELATRAGVATTITDDLIDREVTIEEARAVMFDDVITRGSVRISSATNRSSLDDPQFFRDAVTDAVLTRMNPKHKPSEPAMQFVGLSTSEMARACLQRAGISTVGLGADSLITRALAGDSTSDFPAILINALDKSLRVSYEAAPSGLKDCARETSNVDFRRKWRIMLDATGIVLQPTNENAEFQRAHMVDGAESYAVDTYGNIFSVTRQALVNDDLNAFETISQKLGIAAAMFEAKFLVDLLLSNGGLGPVMQDSNNLFDTDHSNYASSGAVPSVTTLTAARLAMRHQTGIGGGLIHIEPNILVVPAELETVGEQLITEIRPVVVSEVNPFSKLTKMVVEPRLPANAWYLVADPAMVDGLEYAYLARSPGPQLESRLGFEVDGLQVRIRLDFGGGFVDWRGWYKNAGA